MGKVCRRGDDIWFERDAACGSENSVGPVIVSDFTALVEDGKRWLQSIFPNGLESHPEFILLVQNDRESAACILAASELNATCVCLPLSRKTLVQWVQNETGISIVLQPTTTITEKPSIILCSEFSDVIPDSRLEPISGLGMASDTASYTASYSWKTIMRAEGNGSLVLLTSGSTGVPKLVVNSWKSMRAQGVATAKVLGHEFPVSRSVLRLGCHSSIGHAYAINALFALRACSTDTTRSTELVLLSDLAQTQQAFPLSAKSFNVFYGTPGTYAQLVEFGSGPVQIDLPFSAGSPLPKNLRQKLMTKFNLSVLQNYGSTETGTIAAFRNATDESLAEIHAGFVGQVFPGVCVKLLKLTPERQHDQVGGELLIRTPWQSEGYIVNRGLQTHPEYFPSSDFGRVICVGMDKSTGVVDGQEDAAIVVQHRLQPLIQVQREGFCSAVEVHMVETLMLKHPKVINVVVPVQKPGSLRVLVVVEKDGGVTTENDIQKWSELNLPAQYHPTCVEIIPYVLCSPAGKPCTLV